MREGVEPREGGRARGAVVTRREACSCRLCLRRRFRPFRVPKEREDPSLIRERHAKFPSLSGRLKVAYGSSRVNR